jgi:hypothetical protein
MFHVVSNMFSLISNKVLISLHSYLGSTHTNYPTATRELFNFLYKKIMIHIIFIIHVLKLSSTLYRCFL